ncbi:MAG: peptidoglycan DD-metalloendopeptidase family protein [Neisseriaceae bacterium]|nr:peptidoglycan DD-metalloendopeptidase family protein [Neisseriaceae bacterium]
MLSIAFSGCLKTGEEKQMKKTRYAYYKIGISCMLAVLLSACTTTAEPEAEEEEYRPQYPISDDGFYTVREGDTWSYISSHFGRSMETLKCWNKIPDKNKIQLGQKVRVMPYQGKNAKKCLNLSDTKAQEPTKEAAAKEAQQAKIRRKILSDFKPIWPMKGNIVSSFNGETQRGIDIAGVERQAVKAIADGTVVYAGEEVKGYGNSIVIRHNNALMSTYSHNKTLLVGVGRKVQKGQKIAEIGRDKNGQTLLHFEILINNSPVNPVEYLPKQ